MHLCLMELDYLDKFRTEVDETLLAKIVNVCLDGFRQILVSFLEDSYCTVLFVLDTDVHALFNRIMILFNICFDYRLVYK